MKIIYVSINEGNDSWTGEEPDANTHGTGPVKTVERARDIAESTSYANEQIKIIIREGVYSFATPLVLESFNSGFTKELPTIYEAYQAGVNKDVDAGTKAVAVNSGTAALSVIMEDGGVFMFGQNTTGQISRCECLQNIDPNITIETTDTGYGGDGYTYFKFSAGSNLKPVKIDTSDNHTAILLNNGKVYVWGTWQDNTITSPSTNCDIFYTIVNNYPNLKFKDISVTAGYGKFAALTEDNELIVFKIIDSSDTDKVEFLTWDGDPLTYDRITFYNDNSTDNDNSHTFKGRKFKKIELGEDDVIGILDNGKLWCSADLATMDTPFITTKYYADSIFNYYVENLSTASKPDTYELIDDEFIDVTSTLFFRAGIKKGGIPYVWGNVGIDVTANTQYIPVQYIEDGTRAVAVDGGSNGVCWVMENGTVECFGEGVTEDMPLGIDVDASYQIEKISVGDENVIALSKSGKVYAWGRGGKLGEGLNGAVITTSQYVVDLNIKQTIDAYNDTQETVYGPENVQFTAASTLNPSSFTLLTSALDSTTYNKLHANAKGNVYVYDLGSSFDVGKFTTYWHGSWENQSDQLTNTCSEYILPYALYQTNPYCHKGSDLPPIPEISVDDQPYNLARWPSAGYAEVTEVVEAGSTTSDKCDCITADCTGKVPCYSNTNPTDCNYKTYPSTTFMNGKYPKVKWGTDGIFRYSSVYDSIISKWPNPSTNEMFVIMGTRYDWACEGFKVLDINKTDRTIKINSHASNYGLVQFNEACYSRGYLTSQTTTCTCKNVFGTETIPLPTQLSVDTSTCAVQTSYRESNEALLTRKWSTTNQPWRQDYWANPHPRRWYLLNVLEELNSPGQYYIDRTNKKLYIWPIEPLTSNSKIHVSKTINYGSDNKATNFERERLNAIVKMVGARNITFRNINFSDTSGNGIDVIDCKDVKIENCEVYNIRKRGIRVMGGSNVTIDNCFIHDTGKDGAFVAGGDKIKLEECNHIVKNSTFTKTNKVMLWMSSSSALKLHGVGITVRKNKFYDLLAGAIHFYGNNITIEYNNIKDAIQECDDCGAIYTWSNISNRGNIIRYNLFRDIKTQLRASPKFPSANVGSCTTRTNKDPNNEVNASANGWHGTSAIYLDNHASGLTVYGNIFYKCSNSMGKDTMGVIFANYGIDVVASNNIFIECEIPFGSNENALYYDSWTQAQIDTAQITQWEKTINDKPDPWGSTGYSEVGNFLGWGVMMNWNGTTLGDPNSTTFVQYPRIWEANHKEWGALNNCDIRSTVYQTQYPELFGIKQDVNPKSFLYFDSATQLLKVNVNYKRKNYANNNIHIKPGRLPNNSPRLTNTYTVWNQRNNNWVTTNDTIINEVDDAGFVDTINGNFSLKSSSPIKTVSNFDQIPVHLIAGFQQENIEDVSVTPDLTSLPIYYDRQDAQPATWGSSVGDGSTITAESKYLKNNPNTRKYIMVYQKYFESSGAVIPNSGDPDIMIANFKKADLTKTMEQAVIRAAQEYNNYIDLINNDTVNGSKTPVEHMGETPLIVFDFETPIYSSILGWWIADPVTNAEKWGAGTWQFTVNFAKGMIPKAKELIANASFRAQNNIPDIFLNAKFAHYSVPYTPQDPINGKLLQLASDDERFNRRKLLLSDTRLGQIIPTQDFFTVQVYSYYPMSNSDGANPANCTTPLTLKNVYGRDWNQQQIFDSIEVCMDWMRKTGIEKDIYPLISTSYLGSENPSIYTNCDNLLFDVSDLTKDFWAGRQITKEDFLETMKLCYDSAKQRIRGFLIWSGYNYFITSKMTSCDIENRYMARSVYARDVDDTLLTKIQDDDYWPDISFCVPNTSGEILSASADNSNFIKLVIYCTPGYSLEIYRKTTETSSSFQKIATKIIENDITTYYDIDSTLSASKTYVYKTVVSGSSSSEVTGRIAPLSTPINVKDYALWGNEFLHGNPANYANTKAIVPLVNVRFNGSNGQRDPSFLDYRVKDSDWNTFKSWLNAIPEGRRVVGLFPWWRDIGYFEDVTVDYYANTTDGTVYDGKRFPTLWSNKNAEDGQSSVTAFLQRCKDEGLKFDYLLDDKESQYIWHLESAGRYFPNRDGTRRLQDSRIFKAITADSRFTTLKSPVTNKTFAEEFVSRFNDLTGRNLVTSDWYYLLEPYINAGCKPGETASTCYKYPSTYWTHYGCAPSTGNSQTGSPDSCLLIPEKTAGRLRSNWPTGLSDGAGLSAYSLATDVIAAWNAVADNWHFNVYINKQFVEALDKFPEFNNVRYIHYEVEPVSAEEALFWQDSNDAMKYVPNVHNDRTMTGVNLYNARYGLKNIIWPYTYDMGCGRPSYPIPNYNEPNLAADTQFYSPDGNCSNIIKMPIEYWYRNIYLIRSGYALNPKNDLEKYRWIPHVLSPYGGESGESGIQRYPVSDPMRIAEFKATIIGKNMVVTQLISGTIIPKMQLHAPSGLTKDPTSKVLEIVSGSGNNWVVSYSQNVTSPLTIKGYYWKEDNTFMSKWKQELSYKIIVDELKEMRHTLRSDINYYKSFAPWPTSELGGLVYDNNEISYYAYWFEQIYHTLLHGPRHLNLFAGNTLKMQQILDEWRVLSDNRLTIPCSNSTGDITTVVDRITFPDVFTKYLISGGKLEGTDIYIWRITIPPEKFYQTGKVKLTRVGTDTDIPQTIVIDTTSESRGVWIKRNISTPPEYTTSAG